MKQLKIIGLILALNLTGQVFGADAEAHIPEDLQLNVIKPGATNYAKHLVSGNRNYDPFRKIRAACYQENFPVPVTIQYIVNEYVNNLIVLIVLQVIMTDSHNQRLQHLLYHHHLYFFHLLLLLHHPFSSSK